MVLRRRNGNDREPVLEYNRKYQAPVAVTHGKVAEYPEANQITAPAPAEIDGQITDLEYYESLQ